MGTSDVVVIGAGVIGLGIAWRCAQRGLSVTVLDPTPGGGASSTAAGMLAPVTELHYGEQALMRLGIDSLRRYPAFVAELESTTGRDAGYRACGTVVAAWDTADLATLRDLQAFQASLGLKSELVSSRELRRLEPLLAPGLPGGLFAADDHQVDNRLLHKALLAAAPIVIAKRVVELVRHSGRVVGVRTQDGSVITAATFVLAAGAWSRHLDERLPVRPVKGQTLRLAADPLLAHVVRGSVKGSTIYLAQRTSGEIVIGASSEEAGFDLRPRSGAIYELLRDAQSLIPTISELEFKEVSTRVRPGSPDNAPIIGRAATNDLIYATGHYRNGILLTPVTADGIADLIMTGELPDVLRPFTARRFEPENA